VNYLEQAKKLGDILIVAVNADESVKENKGDRRPIVPAPERARMLASLEAVDHVFVFKEKTPHKWLEKIRPDIHVKGGDFRPRQLPEYPVIRSFGGKVKTIGLVKSRSTTDIIKKVLDVYKKTPPKAGRKQ
jgi:rfaE bifunctional protein nucleotidyltransferase chain/domain